MLQISTKNHLVMYDSIINVNWLEDFLKNFKL